MLKSPAQYLKRLVEIVSALAACVSIALLAEGRSLKSNSAPDPQKPGRDFAYAENPDVLASPTLVRPRPRTPQPLPFVPPADRIWVLRGELRQYGEYYSCRVRCQSGWAGRGFQVLQTTRGSEEWNLHEGVFEICRPLHSSTSESFLRAGEWTEHPSSPDDQLCFVVLSDAPVFASPDAL